MTFGQVWWHILRISALDLTHPSAHTQLWTHTHREHTPGAVGMQPYCNLQHLGCNSDSLTIRPWSSPCRWRSWLHAFTVLTNRKQLGLKVTSVWAVLHIIHHQTTDIGLSWVYYWDGPMDWRSKWQFQCSFKGLYMISAEEQGSYPAKQSVI